MHELFSDRHTLMDTRCKQYKLRHQADHPYRVSRIVDLDLKRWSFRDRKREKGADKLHRLGHETK